MMRRRLSEDEIQERLIGREGWENKEGCVCKRFTFPNFEMALDFVNRVGAVAETHDHHPDIKLGWGYAVIAFTTHDAGGITEKDFELVREIDEVR